MPGLRGAHGSRWAGYTGRNDASGEKTMQFKIEKQDQWSRIGFLICTGSVSAYLGITVLDGILQGPLSLHHSFTAGSMFLVWCYDLRILFEQLIYVGAIVFVGGKFIETRSIFTVGFDRLDADKVRFKGPDEDNVVWIGHRYGTAIEAATVADAIQSRLKESAA
jgi:hypothetical protein